MKMIAAQAVLIWEKLFSWKRHFILRPLKRVTGKDCPVPYCKDLESVFSLFETTAARPLFNHGVKIVQLRSSILKY